MSQARHTIFNNIRKSLGRNELDTHTITTLEKRFTTPQVHEQPTWQQALIPRFIKQLQKVGGSLESIPHAKEIPFAVLEFLQKHNLPQELVVDTRLRALPWPNKLNLSYRAALAEDMLSVNHAFAGIAETGSLVLLSSVASPTTLNFLPENHIVVLHRDDLIAHLEDIWTRLRTLPQPLPRTINIITGPSRTADIEQTIQLGAHGPKRLHVILVGKAV